MVPYGFNWLYYDQFAVFVKYKLKIWWNKRNYEAHRKIWGMGGPMFWDSGFSWGGRQVLMGGGKVFMGGGVPPPLLENPDIVNNTTLCGKLAQHEPEEYQHLPGAGAII